MQLRDFLKTQAAEYVPFDHLTGARIQLGELFETLIQCQHVCHVAGCVMVILVRQGENNLTAALQTHAAARVVDQHLPHRARGERQKVRARQTLRAGRQLEVYLVNQRSGIQGQQCADTLPLAVRNDAQLLVRQREQLFHRNFRGR